MRKLNVLFAFLVVMAMILAACGGGTPTEEAVEEPVVEEPTETTVAIQQEEEPTAEPTEETPVEPVEPEEAMYNEAPMLADLVASGDLPPVAERLPLNPLVTPVQESIGQYGGEINTASWWPEVGNTQLFFAIDAPIKWKANLSGYEAALAESYEWSEDGKTFTLHMREGVKWSDGEPYTSEDWRFWWEDLALNEDVKSVSVPGWLRNTDGTPITMEFPDEYTVVWKADKPLWIQPYYMAQGFWEFAKAMMKPAHYLKQFHPQYNPEATFDELQLADQWWQTPGYPCLFAWCLETLSDDAQRYSFTRNPYFWRVDEEGNQLPYIDKFNVELVTDEQVRLLNCSQGKYNAAFRICGSPNDIPFLMEQAESGGYKLLQGWMNGAGAWPGYMVNQYYVEGGKNYENDTPEKAAEIRDILRSNEFRQALSLGIDRERVIEVVWNGIGEAKNYTISPQSWHFVGDEGQAVYEAWANNYTDFDVDTANGLLDGLGMTVGANGFRTLPSGEPFIMTIDISDWGGSLKAQTDAAAEAEAQWEENLKIEIQVNNLQGQPDLDTRTNEGYFMLRGAHISEIDIWTYPDWVFPIVNRYYFPLEGRYYAKGKDTCVADPAIPYDCGVKPEPGSPAEQLQALYEKGLNTGTVEGRHEVVWEAIQVHIDEGPFVIGVAGDQQMPILVANNMRNVLDFGVVGPWAPATPGNQNPSTWWIEP